MITQKEKDLQLVLDYAGLTKLPRAFDPEKSKKVWVDAVIEVRKIDCSVSYAYGYNRYGRNPNIVKVFGNAAAIREIVAVYPINYLTKEFLPELKTHEDLVEYLTTAYNVPTERVEACDAEQLKMLLYTSAIEKQIMSIKTEKEYGKRES